MTALAQYERLEAAGTWRPAPHAQRREVIVSFGDATLVLSDPRSDTPLSHWSLPAVTRMNPGSAPALYAPHPGGTDEELEIGDPDMIAAIDKVHRAIERARPHPGRLRGTGLAILGLLVAGAAFWWLPEGLVDYAARIAPPAQRAAIGGMVLDDMARLTGPACGRPAGQEVLARLSARLLGPGHRIEVLPEGLDGARGLPGGIVVLGQALIERAEARAVEPGQAVAVVVGHIFAADAAAETQDPLLPALRHAGTGRVLQLLTRGALPPDALRGYGAAVLAEGEPRPDDDPILARFSRAGVPSEPYARDLDPSGEATLGLIEANPFRTSLPVTLPVSEAEWRAITAICEG
ncbi:hypothetical protein GI374_13390 [Paracoccus sp. S-4012]|uniref:hypothetical protein n=1 Tax=Paracoccus sp. S-4012 TaxID=2665648 RepID=UPI0012B09A49|nr:hypothetical protein [Paracoccus sp. S-4012]MRX51418.1 hypothetical protein [Paracoccus sp. S-4012]